MQKNWFAIFKIKVIVRSLMIIIIIIIVILIVDMSIVHHLYP